MPARPEDVAQLDTLEECAAFRRGLDRWAAASSDPERADTVRELTLAVDELEHEIRAKRGA